MQKAEKREPAPRGELPTQDSDDLFSFPGLQRGVQQGFHDAFLRHRGDLESPIVGSHSEEDDEKIACRDGLEPTLYKNHQESGFKWWKKAGNIGMNYFGGKTSSAAPS